MTNPTSNFGWQMPTSTDLVTDLPADFEVFGQAVDTTLAELKGGTTGQVLSKTSNTNMDFTWVTTDDANAIQNSIVDAKGDLISATGNDTPARLAVGANGETLVADSSTSTGLRWQGSYPAGKNVLINGLQDIWQRSTSVTFSGGAYNAQDRWFNYASTSSTFARESTIVPAGCTYSCKVTIGASAAALSSEQVIETLNAAPYAGTTMTLSGLFQSSATPSISFVVYWSTAVDNPNGGAWSTITATSGGSGTAGASSFTRISGVYAIPSTAKTLKVLWFSSSMASAAILYWGGMQFEAGSVPTTLVRNGATIQGELAACQRYYYNISGSGVNLCNGSQYNASIWRGIRPHPVPMRVSPSFTSSSGSGYYVLYVNGSASYSSIQADTLDVNAIQYNINTSGATIGHAVFCALQNASARVELSAEL